MMMNMNSTAGFQMAMKMSAEGTFGQPGFGADAETTKKPRNQTRDEDEEEAMIRKAIELSEQQEKQAKQKTTQEQEEEEQMRQVLELSKQNTQIEDNIA